MSINVESLSNIENLNFGFQQSQNDDGILTQKELDDIIRGQLMNSTPIKTTSVEMGTNQQIIQTPTIAPVTAPLYVNNESSYHNTYSPNVIPDKYDINVENVEDWDTSEQDDNKTWIEKMEESPEQQSKKQTTNKPPQKVQEDVDDEEEDEEPPKENKKPQTLKDIDPVFDLDELYKNFNELKKGIAEKIKKIEKKQNQLDSRVAVLEKFINLDEKELAVQYINKSKDKTNTQYIKQLTASILNKTELLTLTMDLSLKHENMILSWHKELFNIEKEKVSSYHKIKNLNKAITETENDINDILQKINDSVKVNNKANVSEAMNELAIGGYGGKPFNN